MKDFFAVLKLAVDEAASLSTLQSGLSRLKASLAQLEGQAEEVATTDKASAAADADGAKSLLAFAAKLPQHIP